MIPTEIFGRTGHQSTRTIFGAAALGRVTQAEADHTLELITSAPASTTSTQPPAMANWSYVSGLGWREYRKEFFLATKTGERTYEKARDQIHRSLERLRVDQVDLLQLHNLAEPQEWEVAMGPGGATLDGGYSGARAGPGALHWRDRPRQSRSQRRTSAASNALTSTWCCCPIAMC